MHLQALPRRFSTPSADHKKANCFQVPYYILITTVHSHAEYRHKEEVIQYQLGLSLSCKLLNVRLISRRTSNDLKKLFRLLITEKSGKFSGATNRDGYVHMYILYVRERLLNLRQTHLANIPALALAASPWNIPTVKRVVNLRVIYA